MSGLLRSLVEKTLDGKAGELKEYTIGDLVGRAGLQKIADES